MCWLFHKWTKWEQYLWHGFVYAKPDNQRLEVNERRQKRHCEKCGYEEERLVI